jgi:SnoaL-like domain
MKTLILALALSATALMATTQTTQAQSSDDAAIKATIDGETNAYHAADYITFKSYWANVPYASMLVNGQQYVGDALWKAADGIFANAKPIKATTTRTGWNIRSVGNTAFVTFEQRDENLDTKAVGETVETRYLEKIGGAWKIVNVSVVPKPAK